MKRPLAATLALALSIMPLSAQPTRAQGTEDLFGLLVGIGALYVIGRAITDDRTTAPAVAQPKSVVPKAHAPQRPHVGVPPKRHFAKVVPSECFRRVETRRGTLRGFPLRCVERTMHRAERLPAYCLTRVRTERGPRSIYRAGCLRSEGWRMDDRPGRYAGW